MSADDVIASLEAAKQKLEKAKTDGLNIAAIIGRAKNSVSSALGRTGARSPLIAQIDAKQKAIHTKVMAIDTLTARIGAAIQQTRRVADEGEGGADGAAPS